MFKFVPREEGYLVQDSDGRGVASIRTRHVNLDRQFVEPRKVAVEIPRADWELHFCPKRLKPAEVRQLLAEIDQLSAEHPPADAHP